MFEALQTILSSPRIPWKLIISSISIGQFVFETLLTYRQYKVLSSKKLPAVLSQEIDDETFQKSTAYSKAKAKFSVFSDVYGLVQNLIIIYSDLFPKLWHLGVNMISGVLPATLKPLATIPQSLCFLIALSNFSAILDLPISYYNHFVLEEKFGFNKLTMKLWIMDMLKSTALSYSIGLPILYLFLKIFDMFPTNFLGYIVLFSLIVQILAMTIIPVFIMPLFNKFTPLEDGELKTSIQDLASRVNFPLDKIYVVDGSKRSSHSNAYFTGLPFTTKRIVLFDTLINSNTTQEITAVLAHEIGHWQKNHILHMLAVSQVHIIAIFYLFSSVFRNESLYNAFGFFIDTDFIDMATSIPTNISITKEFPIIIGLMLFNNLLTPLDCVVQFGMNLFSRLHEYQADAYAKKLGYSQNLSKALIQLQIKNLSTMNVDPLYSSYHYSHPTLAERLDALNYVGEKKVE